MVQDCKKIVQVSKEISKKYWPDTDHYVQVNKLALELFDGLIKLHQLGHVNDAGLNAQQLCMILACQNPGGGHHKKSAQTNPKRYPIAIYFAGKTDNSKHRPLPPQSSA